LWRDTASGLTVDWLGQANGSFASNWSNSAVNISTDWKVAGIGDFNGDGLSDILWRNSAGLTVDWLGQASGSFASNWSNSIVNIPTEWKVAGTGDFNGDGHDDILWRNDSGLVTEWLGQANGAFTTITPTPLPSCPPTGMCRRSRSSKRRSADGRCEVSHGGGCAAAATTVHLGASVQHRR
jgi:hypothetical protein